MDKDQSQFPKPTSPSLLPDTEVDDINYGDSPTLQNGGQTLMRTLEFLTELHSYGYSLYFFYGKKEKRVTWLMVRIFSIQILNLDHLKNNVISYNNLILLFKDLYLSIILD